MDVFELTYPGTWLELPDKDQARKLTTLLFMAESHFVDAVVAFNLFAGERARAGELFSREEWERDSERRRQLMGQVERVLGSGLPLAALNMELYRDVSDRVDIEVKRERWSSGSAPRAYRMRPAFLHARSFVYALDHLGRMLTVISEEAGAPLTVGAEVAALYSAFPTLVGVRDTAHHMEDRGRGLDKWGDPLVLQPAQNAMVSAPNGGALILDCLSDNRYGCTMADGHFGEVEVSEKSLRVAQRCLQGVLDGFGWSGPRRHTPN